MDQPEAAGGAAGKSMFRYYAEILNPLFWHDDFNEVGRMFELVCTLVRAAGLKDTGWDSHLESIELLRDLECLGQIELPKDAFPHPESTRARLALISYAHLTEMNFPYDLIANLLRLRLGLKYCMEPLAHLGRPIVKKGSKGKVIEKIIAPSPDRKIKEIEGQSEKAGLPEVGKALREIYDPVIRNAVYHSDYVVQHDSMRLLSGNWHSKNQGILTPLVPFDELSQLTMTAFAFHSALLALYNRACHSFTDFRNRLLPWDHHYKGLLELTFVGDLLTGFRTYWPNETIGIFMRAPDSRCIAQNLHFDPDGSINFMVGMLASKRGAFSPCVEFDAEPVYAKYPGIELRPYWPDPLAGYRLVEPGEAPRTA